MTVSAVSEWLWIPPQGRMIGWLGRGMTVSSGQGMNIGGGAGGGVADRIG